MFRDTGNFFFVRLMKCCSLWGYQRMCCRDWMFSEASYIMPSGWLNPTQLQKSELPLFANLKYLTCKELWIILRHAPE